MGIGSVTSANRMTTTQITSADLKDQKTKSLQTKITDMQRQMQKLSSEEDLTVTEKAEERKKLQKEESSLTTKLKQHQDDLLRTQKREAILAKLQEDKSPEKEDAEDKIQAKEASSDTADKRKLPTDERQTLQPGTVITQNSDGTVILKEVLNQSANRGADTEDKQADETRKEIAAEKEATAKDADTDADAALSKKEVAAMVSADSSMQQADRQRALVTKTQGAIAVLQGEIKQDADRGLDTERKQAELKDMQKQRTQETAFLFSLLDEANETMRAASETNESAKNGSQDDAQKTFHVSGLNASPEDQLSKQGFQVSIA